MHGPFSIVSMILIHSCRALLHERRIFGSATKEGVPAVIIRGLGDQAAPAESARVEDAFALASAELQRILGKRRWSDNSGTDKLCSGNHS